MKKFLLTTILAMSVTVIWAADTHWTPPSVNDFPNQKAVYCQVSINGVAYKPAASSASEVEVAAFIKKECRADATTLYSNGFFGLQVLGDLKTEKDSAITFKVFYKGIEYTLKKTIAFDSEDGYKPIPLEINLDVISGIKVKSPINVKQKKSAFPYTVDVKDSISLFYADRYTPKEECTSNAEVKYTITTQSSRGLIINGTTAKIVEAKDSSYWVSVAAALAVNGTPINTFADRINIKVALTKTSVSSITCKMDSIARFFAFEDLNAYLKDSLTILPADADNKNYKLSTAPKGGGEQMDIPEKGGMYTVYIYPEDPADDFVDTSIKVYVYVRPTSIYAQDKNIELNLGGDLKKEIDQRIQFTWPNGETPDEKWQAKDVTYEYQPEDMVDSTGKAVKIVESGSAKVVLKEGVTPTPTTTQGGYNSVEFTVKISSALQLKWKQVTTDFYRNGQPSTSVLATLTVDNPASEPFDESKIGVKFGERYTDFPFAEFYEVKLQNGTTDKYDVFITPKFVGSAIPFTVSFNDQEVQCEVTTTSPVINIIGQRALVAGWNWVAVNATDDDADVQIEKAFTLDDIIEARYQTNMMYNDKEKYGVFGDLTDIVPIAGTIKVRAEKATTMTLGSKNIFDAHHGSSILYKGYTWMNNPYEFDITADRISAFLNGITPNDGDILMTQSDFATYNGVDRSWNAGSGFKLPMGEGLMYYNSGGAVFNLTYDPALAPVKTQPSKADFSANVNANEIFVYDKHAFADHMCMIASMNIDNPDNYLVGAYVNGECRGYGEFVNGKTLFINVAGKAGEKVSFQLYNKFNGEMTDISETVSYANILGSMKSPVKLSSPAVSGIEEVSLTPALSLREGVYNLQGVKVNENYKGVVIVNGKKVIK